jgi:hypothetical protein
MGRPLLQIRGAAARHARDVDATAERGLHGGHLPRRRGERAPHHQRERGNRSPKDWTTREYMCWGFLNVEMWNWSPSQDHTLDR